MGFHTCKSVISRQGVLKQQPHSQGLSSTFPLPKEGNKERPGNEVVETRASQLVIYFQISYVYPQTQHSDQSRITDKLQV